jgi:hypothetical protein
MTNQELIILIEGEDDLKMALREPLPAGIKLIGVIKSQDGMDKAERKLGLTRRVERARLKCRHHMWFNKGPASTFVPFSSTTQCDGFVFSHFEGSWLEYFIVFEHDQNDLETVIDAMRMFLEDFSSCDVDDQTVDTRKHSGQCRE